MKKIMSLTLSFVLLLSVFTSFDVTSADAAETDYTERGVNYKLNADKTATVVGGDSQYGYLDIPDVLENEYRVTSIAAGAFKGKLDIQKVNCSAELTEIGDYAFESCSNISAVSFENNIGRVGKGAFSLCSKLAEASFEKSVKSFGDGAFFMDQSMAFMSFPKSVENVGEYCFAFSGLKSLILNKKIEVIPNRFCYGCKALKAVVLPKYVKEIKDYAFCACDDLTVNDFPESLDKIGDNAFESTKVSEPELNCSEIGEEAFENCSSLESVTFSDKLKKVGKKAFVRSNVREFQIKDGVEYADGALAGIVTEKFVVSDDSTDYTLIDGILYSKDKKTLISCPALNYSESYETEHSSGVDIYEATEKIAPYAFFNAVYLGAVNLPDSITEIGEHAFEYADLGKIDIPDGVKEIKPYTYANCEKVTDIDLGKVEKLDDMSFFSCCENEECTVKINDALKSVAPKAFLNSKINFADGANSELKVIDNLLFSADGKTLVCCPGSFSDEVCVVPDGVEKIADYAFICNSKVTEIDIPGSLRTIGEKGIGYYAIFSYGYEEIRMVEGVKVIGNASDNVKQYCNDYNIGLFSASPEQNIATVTMAGGNTAQFKIKNAEQSDVTFSSNDDKIASITNYGTIRALKKGTTYVTAAAGMTYFKCKVTVTSDSGIKYSGFDDSNYRKINGNTYNGWKQNYIDNNKYLSSYYSNLDDYAISAYQGDEFYRAMNGAADPDGVSHASGEAQYGEGFEDMINMISHGTNTELSRYTNTDSVVLYSGAKPYVSKLIAGEKDSLKNLRSKIGKTFDHPQFISTTISQEVSHNFYSGQDGVVLIIYAEKEALQNLPSGYIAAFHPEGEFEQLFQSGSKFEIIDAGVRWYDGESINGKSIEEGFERYIKIRLLGGKDKPSTLAKPSVTLEKSSASMYVKKTAMINATINNSYDSDLKYKSSNTKVVKVSSKGKMTAVKKGTAVITVFNSEASARLKVTVNNPKLNKTSKTLKKGKTFALKITGRVGTATFTSSNNKIAAVTKAGKVTAKKKGKAIITVKTNGITLKCKITVK